MKLQFSPRLLLPLFVIACSDEDIPPVAFSEVSASDISFTSANLNSQFDQINEEVTTLGFYYAKVTGQPGQFSELDLTDQPGTATARITGLSPETTYRFHLHVETASQDIYSESQTFTTAGIPVNTISLSPSIGTGTTPIILYSEGLWSQLTEEDRLSLVFDFLAAGWQATSHEILSIGPDSLVFAAPDGVYVHEIEFSNYNVPVSLWINDKAYPVGKFQYTSSFYVSPETLSAQAGETFKVVTQNGSTENTFMIGDQTLEKSLSWLIANGVHENTLTLPDNLTPGQYELKVSTKYGHPMAVLPGETAFINVID